MQKSLIWNPALGLEMEAASLCQSALDPQGTSEMFHSYISSFSKIAPVKLSKQQSSR